MLRTCDVARDLAERTRAIAPSERFHDCEGRQALLDLVVSVLMTDSFRLAVYSPGRGSRANA